METEQLVAVGSPYKSTDKVPPGKSIMRYMTDKGDTKHIWDPENPAECEAAEVLFNSLVKEKKYTAFEVRDDGEKGERMKTFNKRAGKVILVAQLKGG